eukprot:12483371-Prorocentrum_lima.AAC.1
MRLIAERMGHEAQELREETQAATRRAAEQEAVRLRVEAEARDYVAKEQERLARDVLERETIRQAESQRLIDFADQRAQANE